MKKKIIACMLIIGVVVSTFSGCGKEKQKEMELQPQEAKILDICELATQEYVLSTVAKNVKLKDKGWLNLLDQDREVWIQYEGVVPVGVELSPDFLDVKGNEVRIKAPKAVVSEPDILENTFTKDSFFISEEKWYSSNDVTAEFQKELLIAAQKELKTSVEQNEELLQLAENRAKELIENYISELGKMAKKEYTIKWIE